MAKFVTRRILVIAAIALTGGAVVAGVAGAASGGNGKPASSSSGSSSVTTAPVVRTSLSTTVQIGGSIGYNGSYTVAAPSGASASEVRMGQQTVTQDQQTLSSDEQAESDATAANNVTIAGDEANVTTAQSTLTADQATEKKACAGTGASSSACSSDQQKVSTDQAALNQAQQQLATAESTAKTNHDTGQAKVEADQITLQGNENTLTSDKASAVNPGTTYTWLPAVGQVIKEDQPVYSVSNDPVPLLYGSIAAYRAFYTGMSDGADVGELSRDLIALGYGAGLTQSDGYSSATAAAVERWQKARKLPETGEILLGEVVFEPGPIRVTSITPSVGASYGGSSGSGAGGGGTVLTATSTTPIVTVDLDVTQEYLVKPGDAVSVVMPDGSTTVGGRVETVGNVATCPGGSGTGTGNGSSSSTSGSPCSSTGSSGSGGSNSSPTVTLTVTLDSTPPGATLDQAPVNVDITSQTVNNVLAVPVNALLALAGGGYGVEVVSGSTTHLVAVTTGLYSNTMVQISGSGITEGDRVEVPSS